SDHATRTDNPHNVTAVQAGAIPDAAGAIDALNLIASSIRTTNGGTEANRLAVTDASGAVGNALLLKGRDIAMIVDNLYLHFWFPRTSGTTQNLFDIAYGGGMWV